MKNCLGFIVGAVVIALLLACAPSLIIVAFIVFGIMFDSR